MPVFTTAAASLRARRASRNPSLAAPLTTDTANTAAPDATAPAPTSPPAESESIVLKARRAYERDRQRAKKRKERADRERERNASSHSTSDSSTDAGSGRRHGAGRAAVKPRLATDADAKGEDRDALPSSPGVEEIIADVVEREAQARGVSEPVQVHLEQLVKPSKARKSKAGEFELVPGMPVVIALDDHIPGEAELDEPWEHISADELDEKRVAPPSYATVLANAL